MSSSHVGCNKIFETRIYFDHVSSCLSPKDLSSWLCCSKRDRDRLTRFGEEQFALASRHPYLKTLAEGFKEGKLVAHLIKEWLGDIGYKPKLSERLYPFVAIVSEGGTSSLQALLKTAHVVGKWLKVSGFNGANGFVSFLDKSIEEGRLRANQTLFAMFEQIYRLYNPPSQETAAPSGAKEEVQNNSHVVNWDEWRGGLDEMGRIDLPQGNLDLFTLLLPALPAEVLFTDPIQCNLKGNFLKDLSLLGAFKQLKKLVIDDGSAVGSEQALRSMLAPEARERATIEIMSGLKFSEKARRSVPIQPKKTSFELERVKYKNKCSEIFKFVSKLKEGEAQALQLKMRERGVDSIILEIMRRTDRFETLQMSGKSIEDSELQEYFLSIDDFINLTNQIMLNDKSSSAATTESASALADQSPSALSLDDLSLEDNSMLNLGDPVSSASVSSSSVSEASGGSSSRPQDSDDDQE